MASIDLHPSERTPLSTVFSHVLHGVLRTVAVAVVGVLAVAAGIGSSRYLISRGSLLSSDMYGPWQHWRTAGTPSADPYTRAHFARTGELRISADSAGVYEARTDDTGARLHSSCNYLIEGPETGGLWWSLAVFDSRGRLIANDASRYSFTRDTAAPNPDGSFIVSLGRDARPGNWLPTGGAGRIVLMFTLLDPATGFSEDERRDRAKLLPVIRREGCS